MKHLSSLWRRLLRVNPLTLFLLVSFTAAAQAPPWQTAVAASGNSIVVRASTAGPNGTIYLVGTFGGTVTFGNTQLTTAGAEDVFVAKWSSTAGFVWAQQAGGTSGDFATAVAVSGANVYVGGVFTSRGADFGGTFLTNADTFGNTDIFVAKLTDAGATSSFGWAVRGGSQPSERLTGLVASGTSVYATGDFLAASVAFGPIKLAHVGNTVWNYNLFVVKITDAGNFGNYIWAEGAGGATGSCVPNALAISGNNLYVTGDFTGSAVGFGTTVLPTAGGLDLFVAKLVDAGATGSFAWAQPAGGTGNETGNAIAVSGTNLYLTGYFSSPTLAIGSSTLVNAGSLDAFVAKLSDAGATASFVWGQQAGGADGETGKALAVSGANVYVTGSFTSAAAAFGSTTLATVGQADVFLTKLVDAGSSASISWAQQAGGPDFDSPSAVAVLGTSVYVTGSFSSSSITFGSQTLTKTSPGSGLFLASLVDATISGTSSPALRGSAFTVAPNPACTAATVQLSALPGAATATLTLLDGLGRPVRTAVLPLPAAGLRHEMNLHGLSAGIYALRVRAGLHAATRRLVVE